MRNNDELVRHLIKNGILQSPRLVAAFRTIDRQDFVALAMKDQAYEDCALGLGYGATISQPTTVAFMLEKLDPAPGDKVLDIGAGSGWTTALLAQLVGEAGTVYGVELVPRLVAFGRANLSKYNLPNASIVQATPTLGLPTNAPFDRILVSASTKHVPSELVAQLSIPGTLIIPVGEALWQIKKRSETKSTVDKYPGFVFVPLQN